MATPLSKYLAKAIVPIKERMPTRRITSKKADVLKVTDVTATPEIRLIPIASSACTLSGIDGPFTRRYIEAEIDNVKNTIETVNNISNNTRHLLYRLFEILL